MQFYKYERSRSFTDVSPRFFRFSSVKILSKTTGFIGTTLHINPQWGWEIKVCSWDLGHMTKMVIMPIYGKKDLKVCIMGSKRLMTSKPSIQHWGLWLYLVYLKDDPWLTLAYFSHRFYDVRRCNVFFSRQKRKKCM